MPLRAGPPLEDDEDSLDDEESLDFGSLVVNFATCSVALTTVAAATLWAIACQNCGCAPLLRTWAVVTECWAAALCCGRRQPTRWKW